MYKLGFKMKRTLWPDLFFVTIIFNFHGVSGEWCYGSIIVTNILNGTPTLYVSHYENMALKITLKSATHWNTSETTLALKSFTKDNHTESFSLITLKLVSYCYSRMFVLITPLKLTKKFSALLISFSRYFDFSGWFSVS